MPEARRCIVEGLVQGVAFRAFSRDKARSLGLSGFVRNLPDGRVETVFSGTPGAMDEFERWLGEEGSPYGRVSRITCAPYSLPDGLLGFEIRF
ncbi:Acylphosphatase [Desulfovibrio sp. X2]|uniref:acylphosphatase n=1 Tax=Desulfovibrio sp. X2 TaxID=941449 RepID=UPI000358A3E3|nr:acylphosphatase [Desulfovibrio sp. X2]EPR44766.1 Acylphosphatase [Desulfovibrio sp. X2]